MECTWTEPKDRGKHVFTSSVKFDDMLALAVMIEAATVKWASKQG